MSLILTLIEGHSRSNRMMHLDPIYGFLFSVYITIVYFRMHPNIMHPNMNDSRFSNITHIKGLLGSMF